MDKMLLKSYLSPTKAKSKRKKKNDHDPISRAPMELKIDNVTTFPSLGKVRL